MTSNSSVDEMIVEAFWKAMYEGAALPTAANLGLDGDLYKRRVRHLVDLGRLTGSPGPDGGETVRSLAAVNITPKGARWVEGRRGLTPPPTPPVLRVVTVTVTPPARRASSDDENG